MVMIKVFEDRYINSDSIDQIFIDKEGPVWNVTAITYLDNSDKNVRIWMGQFDTLKEATKAVERMFLALGLHVYEFIPGYN